MPTVPVYNANIQEQGLPNARIQSSANLEAFGGGKAAEDPFKGLLATGVDIAKEEKIRYDTLSVQDHDNDLARIEADIRNKASQMKGKDALGVNDFIQSEWTKAKDSLSKNLSNDYQRERGSIAENKRYNSLYEFGLKHSTTEMAAHELHSTTAAVALAQNDVANNYKDPKKVVDSINHQVETLTNYAMNNGLLGTNEFKKAVSDAVGKSHSLVINSMLSAHEDPAAAEYFKEFKSELGQYRDEVGARVQQGTLRGQSQVIVDKFISKGLTQAEANEELRSIGEKNPELRDAVSERYQHELTRQSNIEKEKLSTSYEQLYKIVDDTRSMDDVYTNPLYQNLPSDMKEKLRASYKKKLNDEAPEKNSNEYYRLERLYAEDRSKFNEEILITYKDEVEESQLAHLINLQTKDGRSGDVLDGIRTKRSIVDGALREMNIKTGTKASDRDVTLANNFRRLVDQEINVQQNRTNKKATTDDVDAITKKLSVEVITKKRDFWFDEKKRSFELSVENIPATELNLIDSALRQMRVPVTDQNRLMLYRNHNAK